MKSLKYISKLFLACALGAAALILSFHIYSFGNEPVALSSQPVSTITAPAAAASPSKPKYVRGVHVTSWIAGSQKMRQSLDKLLEETEINTLVIDIKEYEGEIYLRATSRLKNTGLTFQLFLILTITSRP